MPSDGSFGPCRILSLDGFTHRSGGILPVLLEQVDAVFERSEGHGKAIRDGCISAGFWYLASLRLGLVDSGCPVRQFAERRGDIVGVDRVADRRIESHQSIEQFTNRMRHVRAQLSERSTLWGHDRFGLQVNRCIPKGAR